MKPAMPEWFSTAVYRTAGAAIDIQLWFGGPIDMHKIASSVIQDLDKERVVKRLACAVESVCCAATAPWVGVPPKQAIASCWATFGETMLGLNTDAEARQRFPSAPEKWFEQVDNLAYPQPSH